ncbi:MAG: RsmB/NOP family class I SAM-dependent RNA methyltransferase [Candidatus Pacearchaeota archaeon]|nr:RsmB/NOP family class I SAM-dependent RNA methyltransferase [Candidatus Pacearchaeota archaeon]
MIELKPAFKEYLEKLLPDEKDREAFFKIATAPTRKIIRCNTIKTSPEKLKKRLESRGWKISQPCKTNPETTKMDNFRGAEKDPFSSIMIIESELRPGELGKNIEHQLGMYYVQELSSMMSAIALSPKEHESVLDICAAPGSKTTQLSAMMNNTGLLLANDVKIDRLSALISNTERCGCMNVVATRMDGVRLCQIFEKRQVRFDKILVDAPCSGEGVIRSDHKVWKMWNPSMIRGLSALQKKLVACAVGCLKKGGALVYSTCTFEPQECEEVVQFAIDRLGLELEEFQLPLKTREGLSEWNGKKYSNEVKKCKRVFPQDNDTEGFFVAKLKKL